MRCAAEAVLGVLLGPAAGGGVVVALSEVQEAIGYITLSGVARGHSQALAGFDNGPIRVS